MNRILSFLLSIAIVAVVAGIVMLLSPGKARAEGYIGAFAGMTVMDTTVTVGGIKAVDQGGDAATYGLRLGYRTAGPGLVLGAEGEVAGYWGRSRLVVPASASLSGRTEVYNYELNWSVAGYGVIGWRTQGNAAFFARGGVMSISTSSGQINLPVVGIGAEVPFAPGWAARLDGTYAWNDVEHYGLTVGLIYRF